MVSTRSKTCVVEFRGHAADDVVQHFVHTGFGCGADVEFGVVQFGVTREVVGVVHILVAVETLSQDLQSGVAFADNTKSEFVFLFLKHRD